MTKIAILCPTRGRPQQCKRMTRSVTDTATFGNYEFWLGIQEDQREAYTHKGQGCPCFIIPDWPTVMTWNVLAQQAIKDPDVKLFMLGADDIVFETPGWDKALVDHYEQLENKIHVYHLRDSRDPDGTPHPIVTRDMVEALGYFVPPIFLHWWVDTWICSIARSNQCFTHLTDFLLTHDKPSDTGHGDKTHNRIRSMGWHERDKYVNDTCQQFLELEKFRLGETIKRKAKIRFEA